MSILLDFTETLVNFIYKSSLLDGVMYRYEATQTDTVSLPITDNYHMYCVELVVYDDAAFVSKGASTSSHFVAQLLLSSSIFI